MPGAYSSLRAEMLRHDVILMKRMLILLPLLLAAGGCVHSAPHAAVYQGRYAKYYDALREKPICQDGSCDPATEVYRFLSLPTFDSPMLVRIDVRKESEKIITFKKTSGKGGYEPGTLVSTKTATMTEHDFAVFTNLLHEAKFWSLPERMPVDPMKLTLDGTCEVIEAVKDGKHHIVGWGSPDGGPYLIACIRLKRLGFPEDLCPPPEFFEIPYSGPTCRRDIEQLNAAGTEGTRIEEQIVDIIGSPQVEEPHSNGRNAYYRLRSPYFGHLYGAVGIRYDDSGRVQRMLTWNEGMFSGMPDNKTNGH
jgi:hypothetical protein